MKKLFLFSILLLGLLNVNFALAAHLVPKNVPLQPFPNTTITPNLSNNINTPGNTNNINEQAAQKQTAPPTIKQPGVVEPGIKPETNPANIPLSENLPSGQATWLYWALLVVGVLGLGGILLWVYQRFGK